MLHKTHNSVVTLAILLSLVGVSKPAKAFLLAQSDTTPTTFTVPDKLPQDSAVKIATSNSTSSIAEGLNEGFSNKYPQAKVTTQTQSSDDALKSLSGGKTDLVAIGRNLTPAEKEQGFISVPISREKIAIFVSNNNSYDGNLTIDQFAKIFRGEITNWSELGRDTPGEIKLVDSPDSNDTRQAFPNYPVFQAAEFNTGANAAKLDQDNTDSMIAELGDNGIGYAVANDVISRDDVKIVPMHQTLPDDQRYPFSEPFNLVYQGTPSEAVQAYLGFATTEGGKQVIANRVGSVATTAAIASGIASNPTGQNSTTATVNSDTNGVNSKTDANTKANVDPSADGNINPAPTADKDNKVVADANGANTDLDKSGEANPDVQGSGEANPDVQDSGEVNPDVQGSGEANPDVQGSGEVNPDVQGSGESLSVEGDTSGEEATAKKGKWWWWLPLILGIPLLGAIFAFGGRKKSDQEPAISDLSNPPDGGIGMPDSSGGGDIPPVGANVGGNTASTTSSLNNATLATGGTALAGGAAAANSLGRKRGVDNNADIDLDSDEPNLVNEIPSNPVSEFSGQETNLQLGDQSTKLQVDEDFDSTDAGLTDDIGSGRSAMPTAGSAIAGGAAALGGAAAAAGFMRDSDTSTNEVTEDSVVENFTTPDIDTPNIETSTVDSPTSDVDVAPNPSGLVEESVEGRTDGEFSGDFVLEEETKETAFPTDVDAARELNLTETAEDVTAQDTVVEEIATPELDLDTVEEDTEINPSGIVDSTTQAGGAAATGFFDRDLPNTEDEDTEIDSAGETTATEQFELDTSEQDTEIDIVSDIEQDTVIDPVFDTEEDSEINPISDNTEQDTVIDPVFDNTEETAQLENGIDSGFFDPEGSVETPVDAEFTSEESGITDFDSDTVNRTTQAGFAGGAAALGGGAAAASFFNRDRGSEAMDAEFTAEENTDSEIDIPEVDSDFNLDLTEIEGSDTVEEVNTPELDLSLEEFELNNDLGSNDQTSTSETTTSGFFDRSLDTEQPVNFRRLDDFAISETTSRNVDNSLENITFDDAVEAEDLSLSEITFDNADSVDASLEDMTFDDPVQADNIDLESITLEDDNTIDASLEEITFDDVNQGDIRFNEITLDDVEANSINDLDLANDADTATDNQNLDLDNLGFEDVANRSSGDLLSDSQAGITSLSDDQANDMNNISEWLDSLETPKKETDNISEWLDTLDKDNFDSINGDVRENESNDLTEESDDISFQFLEDLLDRDADENPHNP